MLKSSMKENNERYTGLVKEVVADYIERESNRTSLVTITNVSVSKDSKTLTFAVSVYPEKMEAVALAFLKRKRSECRDYVKSRVRLRRIPFVDFVIDEGEKHRRKVDELLAQDDGFSAESKDSKL